MEHIVDVALFLPGKICATFWSREKLVNWGSARNDSTCISVQVFEMDI